MIIRLKLANFSENNIGELNKSTIFCHGSGLLSADFTSPADKGTTATIKVTTLGADYGADAIKVTMKKEHISPTIESTGTNEYTITIQNVTGRIEVLVGEVVSGGDSGDSGIYNLSDFIAMVGKKDGIPKYDGTTYSFLESTSWSHCIAPLSTYNVTYATTLTGKENHNGGVAPILFLSSETLVAENIVGFLVGTATNEALTNDAFRIYDGAITPPSNATHIVICDFNNHSAIGTAELDNLLKITVS